jgi:2-keto-4-pentenoate hydratase/2-oxohepta-3-ene-1,7-dioic acid hydratase in catechol pathway
MRVASYWSTASGWRAGVLQSEVRPDGSADVVDCADAVAGAGSAQPGVTVRQMLTASALDAEMAASVAAAAERGQVIGGAVIGPPVPDPDKILCIGVNYRDHADESDMAVPVAPIVFAKFRNSLAGPRDAIVLPAASDQVDFEGEMAVVIGRTCRRVRPEQALDCVAGAFPLNDVSARDLQLQVSQWTTGKAIDTFAPCGPELVLLDDAGDLGSLTLTTRVNGKVVQHASTADMIFGVPRLVSFLSQTMTLVPGDIIATGTPSGVGFARTPPLFLRAGDTVDVEIEGLGVLSNPVILESARHLAAAPFTH